MSVEIEKVYDPKKVESNLYAYWVGKGFFSSSPDKNKKPFTIVIPPPNVTGSLHMGHALNNVLQDIIARFKKLQGFNMLWVPGTDHGGIATQNVVEKLIKSEGHTRHEIGREKFLEKMWEWRHSTGDTILNQLKKLGCSLDWTRTRFTMDETCSNAVQSAFVELYNKGLIYRGKRLVNWCTRCHTALSDIEVEHVEEKGKLWHIRYPLKDAKNQGESAKEYQDFIIVATTRPETMLGDTAVAVNPSDKRYKKLIGKTIVLPLMKREIPIVSDHFVDQTFGTGAVKVTPAHDKNDYEISLRHNLNKIEVIDFHGKMTKEASVYEGLDIYQARKKVLEDLEKAGLLLETKDHLHSRGYCYRCNTIIEPLMSEQWFLKVENMSKKAMEVVENGKVRFYPDSWKKPYLLWLENLRDWCISRQIWWGHRIPVYYCRNSDKNEKCKPIASMKKPEKCPNCSGTEFTQDEDVLDTWFSSALWPFSVFGWPKKEAQQDLNYYYPTSVLVTGHEILYLWVARMVQMGLEFINDIPFSEVFIHGIVRDKSGKKMSKSLGNVIDPLEIMSKFGTDALRFSLTQAAAPGRDMQLSDESFLSARNFANKIWNASRFVMMNVENLAVKCKKISDIKIEETSDKWILSEYYMTVEYVTKSLEKYNMDAAARALYDFFWFKYCDWYVEMSKKRLNGIDENAKQVVLSILMEILSGFLRLIHPIMPFITETIWQNLVKFMPQYLSYDSIMISKWPEIEKSKIDNKSLQDMNLVQNLITSIRTIRSEMNVSPAKNISVSFKIVSKEQQAKIELYSEYIKSLAKVEKIEIGKDVKRLPQSAVTVVEGIELIIPLAGLIDLEKEKLRLKKNLDNALVEKERCKAKMSNENFMKRAPENEIEKIEERLKDANMKIEKLQDSINALR